MSLKKHLLTAGMVLDDERARRKAGRTDRFVGTKAAPLTKNRREWNRLASKAQRNARALQKQGYTVPEEFLHPTPPNIVTKKRLKALDVGLAEMRGLAVRRDASGSYVTAATDKALSDAYRREVKRIRGYISRRAKQGFIFDFDKLEAEIGSAPSRPTEADVKRLADMRGVDGILRRFGMYRLSAEGEVFSIDDGLEQIKRGDPFDPYTTSGRLDERDRNVPGEEEQPPEDERREDRPDDEYIQGVIATFRLIIGQLCSMLNGDVDPETGLMETSRSYMESTLDRWLEQFGEDATARVIVRADREGLIDSDHLYLYASAIQTAATMTQFFQDQGFILPYERELIQEEMEAGEVWYDYDNAE